MTVHFVVLTGVVLLGHADAAAGEAPETSAVPSRARVTARAVRGRFTVGTARSMRLQTPPGTDTPPRRVDDIARQYLTVPARLRGETTKRVADVENLIQMD